MYVDPILRAAYERGRKHGYSEGLALGAVIVILFVMLVGALMAP